VLRRESWDDPGPRWVVEQAEAELVTRYGMLAPSELGLRAVMFEPPLGAFVIARDGDDAVAGGVGLRRIQPDDDTGEVKRLWVDPGRRQGGLGRALMAALEDEARRMGLAALDLATGERQPEAMALYEATGWERPSVDRHGDPLACGYIRYAKRLV
jgi:GNAT superfamily N-acetyltransferase